MPTCPNGHQSASDDWCEVCGHRMGTPEGPPAVPSYGYGFPPTAGEPTAQAELCPQCRTPREAMAPFCEECRYNFLTRAATPYTPPPVPDPMPPAPGAGAGPGGGARPRGPPPPPRAAARLGEPGAGGVSHPQRPGGEDEEGDGEDGEQPQPVRLP
ncbi:forkhead-associated protein, partial [Streptomyces yangpuensis]